MAMKPKQTIECRDTPGKLWSIAEAAAAARVHYQTFQGKLHYYGGEWFSSGGKWWRRPPKDDSAKRIKTKDAIVAAIDRGMNGLATDSDVKRARGWAWRMQQQYDAYQAVLAGDADLVIEGGDIRVLRHDVPMPSGQSMFEHTAEATPATAEAAA